MLAAFVSAPAFGGSSMLTSTRPLVVRDAVATPSGPTLEFTEWSVVTTDSGARIACPPGGCGPVAFGETFSTQQLGLLEGHSAIPPLAVAWEVSVAADGASMLVAPPYPPFVSEPVANGLAISVPFSSQAAERCVRVTTRDLRSGASVVSDPICASPPTMTPVTYDGITSCTSAPPGYEERWCRARGGTGTPCAIGGAAGVGGSGGMPPTPGGAGAGGIAVGGAGANGFVAGTAGVAGSRPSDPGTGGQAGEGTGAAGSGARQGMTGGTDSDDAGAANDDEREPSGRVVKTEGCGCRAPRSQSNALGVVAVLVAAALGARRRRRA
jgi:MYXO-CTERM domain-containing protein